LSREQSTAVLRPEQGRDGEFRGGAIAGDGYLAIQSTISRKKYTTSKNDPDEEPREACGLEKRTVATR
jgi:hypothetical protein